MSSPDANTLFDFDLPALTDLADAPDAVVRQVNYETASNHISQHHYLGAPGSTVYAFGLFAQHLLAGVITFGTIPGPNARGICGPEHASKVLELTRLHIHDWLEGQPESWFIGQVFRLMKPRAQNQGGMILLSYADTDAGHVGTIYQATNWTYTGESVASKSVMPDGSLVHNRIASDARRGASGAGLKQVAQPPKHRYVHFLGNRRQTRTLRDALAWPTLPYPKVTHLEEGYRR